MPAEKTLAPRAATLTLKQRHVLDYMRGNGCVLSVRGWRDLCARTGLSNRGLASILSKLADKGLVDVAAPPAPDPRYRLTEDGKRV